MARTSRKHLYDSVDAASPSSNERVIFNAGGYIRLSSDDKKKRGDSLETQRNIIENFIATASDIRLTEVYSDNNTTGTNFERPGFQRMLADIERGRINCIIVKDLTRFGRNAIDAGYYLERVLPPLGVRFISVTDSHDSFESDGGILLPLKNIISESYALDIGRKCRAVQRQNIADGRYVGRLAPYGYMKSPDDCHRLVIDEETAPLVKCMFAWASEGISANEIARRLCAEGVLTPGRYNHAKGYSTSEKLRGSEYWKSNTVKLILSDRVYVGDMVQGKTQTVNGVQIDIDRSKWVCVSNTHEAILSLDVFNRVQAMRLVASEKAKAIKETTPYSANVFKGKVFCAHCGFHMKRKRHKNGTYQYRCESQLKYGKDTCTIVSVQEADLKTYILTVLHKQAEAILGKYITLEQNAEKSDGYTVELREINQGLDKDGRMLKSLYESMVSGLITQDEFVQMKSRYEANIEALSIKADEIRNFKYEMATKATEYRDLADAVSAAIRDDALTAEITTRLVQEIRVSPDKTFDVTFLFRDEFKGVRHAG